MKKATFLLARIILSARSETQNAKCTVRCIPYFAFHSSHLNLLPLLTKVATSGLYFYILLVFDVEY